MGLEKFKAEFDKLPPPARIRTIIAQYLDSSSNSDEYNAQYRSLLHCLVQEKHDADLLELIDKLLAFIDGLDPKYHKCHALILSTLTLVTSMTAQAALSAPDTDDLFRDMKN